MSHSYMHTQAQRAGVDSVDKLNPRCRMALDRRPSTGSACVSRGLAGLFAVFMLCVGSAVMAADDLSRHFDINAKPLAGALMEFGAQSGLTVVAPTTLTAGKKASEVRGEFTPTEALGRLLKGSGLTFARAADSTIAIEAINPGTPRQANASESDQYKDLTKDSEQISEVIVTAQRRSEALLEVAAPVTALQASDLARQGDVRLADYAATVPGLNLILVI